MTSFKTYCIEIWVSDCYLATDIQAVSPAAAEQHALYLWEQSRLEPVENIQEVTSTYVAEVLP